MPKKLLLLYKIGNLGHSSALHHAASKNDRKITKIYKNEKLIKISKSREKNTTYMLESR